jgi:hypothetical protein
VLQVKHGETLPLLNFGQIESTERSGIVDLTPGVETKVA